MSDFKIVFVVNGHDAGLRRWSVGYLSDALVRLGVESSVIDLQKDSGDTCDDADAVLIYRSFDARTMNLMKRIKEQNRFLMFFLDDYLFQPKCKYTGEYKLSIVSYLQMSDCLVSSSSVLLSKMSEKPKILRRSVLDDEAMKVLSQEYRRDKVVFSIGWLAGRGRQGLMDDFSIEFLKELDRRLQNEKCIFKCFGHFGMPTFKKIQTMPFPYRKPEDWRGLYSRFVIISLALR